MIIDRVDMKVYSHESILSKTVYYGIRVYDKNSDLCREIDFSNKGNCPRVKEAKWETQTVPHEEELIGFYY